MDWIDVLDCGKPLVETNQNTLEVKMNAILIRTRQNNVQIVGIRFFIVTISHNSGLMSIL